MTTNTPATSGFDLNRPTVIHLLYLCYFLSFGLAPLIGLVLAYVWAGEAHEAWEDTHYRYAIRTFWIGLLYSVIAGVLMIVLVGFFLYFLVAIWFAVRSVRAIFAAQRREPVIGVESWLW
jgi:uncharacterized membrane protein